MSRGMIDSPIRAMPRTVCFHLLSRSRVPLFPLSSPRAFISLRAVQFIPHSRTVRAPMATTFNKYRINAFTARRTDVSGPIQAPRRPSRQICGPCSRLLSRRAFVLEVKGERFDLYIEILSFARLRYTILRLWHKLFYVGCQRSSLLLSVHYR